ncbi:MAG TPA: SMP-30/gluconolactonase/LRE family protein [Verrucomicrobiae bacterium]|nr:SMP-30/gluconolactonase/LRE family protein [Verrucomicrobiae bacterium]
MARCFSNSSQGFRPLVWLLALAVALVLPSSVHADKKKKKDSGTASDAQAAGPRKFNFDLSKLVWPSPPNIARLRYLDYFAGEKIDYTPAPTKKVKESWMDRLAGTQPQGQTFNPKTFPFQLIGPYGIAVDSKGLVYVADQKVGAIFIFNTETRDTQMIRNGYEAHFGWINGIAIDDDDRMFVSDGKLRRIFIFNPAHQLESQISEGLVDPVGLALDTENRFLYVADTQQDQVLVYDADSHKLLRHIGTGGKNHFLTDPGNFAAPQGVAVDKDGNLYVTDTLNNRVEIFDPDGDFISEFGKHGDGPGYFARPKGIAVDADGHIWVADEMQDRLQAFNRDGQLLMYVGGHGQYPGQFKALVGVAIDKQNRIFTTEQYPGRLQIFRYVTDDEAAAEKKRQEDDAQAAAERRHNAAAASAPSAASAAPDKPAQAAPAKAPDTPPPAASQPKPQGSGR